MNGLKRLVTLKTGMLLTSMLMLVYLAQVTFAQDAPAEEPTAPEATATAFLTETPTDLSPATQVVTEVPTIPESTAVVITAVTTEIIPIRPTEIPPISPSPEAQLVAASNPVAVNGLLTVSVQAANLSSVYGAALLCLADPAHLLGLQAQVGTLFTPEKLTTLDNGFQPDGQWALIASQGEKAPELASSGTLWTLIYKVTATGATTLTCHIQLAGRLGQPVPIVSNVLTLTVEGYQPVTVPDGQPSATPVLTVVAPPTAIPTVAPVIIVTAAPTPIPTFHLQGYLATPYPLPQVTVTLAGTQGQQSVLLAADASFAFDVPSGVYQLTITAPYHLSYSATVTLVGQPILLPLITLQNGDLDSNGRIDANDVAFIIQSFGMATNSDNHLADLNRDGVINIYDLAIISANIRS